jgi:uncharacterized protein YraI
MEELKMKKITSILLTAVFMVSAFVIPAHGLTQQTIIRSQAEHRALQMINLSWKYTKSKNGVPTAGYTSYITAPKQFSNVTSANEVGIPYCWSGFDGLNTSSYKETWSNFLDAVNKGAYAGNVNTSSGFGHILGTAGLDCSGFIQAVFNINVDKLSTSTIFNKYFVKIDMSSIKHMDILNRPGYHAAIFDRWGTINGVQGAYTFEATTDQYYGGIQGTKRYFLTMKQINAGYIAGRYINILDDKQTTTVSNSQAFKVGSMAIVANVQSFANFRQSPTTNSTDLCTIPKGAVVYLFDYSNGWYKINYGNYTGWIYGNLLVAV